MTWCCNVRCSSYHWTIDLYDRLNLPVIPAVINALQKANVQRAALLEKEKSDKVKKNRVMMKVARTEDQQARRKWLKRQNIEHSYGNDVDDEDDNDEPTGI
jgi:predicted solute-binding protein